MFQKSFTTSKKNTVFTLVEKVISAINNKGDKKCLIMIY
jgi:hypothetical protein